MGDIHLLGSNLHVLWLCLTYTVRFESIVLFIHILSTHNLLFSNIFLTPPPFVSNGQHSTYPSYPPRQQWSAFGLPPLPPSSAMVSICHTPSPPSVGWRNMWTAPKSIWAINFKLGSHGISLLKVIWKKRPGAPFRKVAIERVTQ